MNGAATGQEQPMTVIALPGDLDRELARRQQAGLEAWRAELARVLEDARLREQAGLEPTPEERMLLRSWLRTRTAVDACLLRQVRAGEQWDGSGPRAVVALDPRTVPGPLEQELVARGLQLVGRGTELPVVLALVVVEQPDLLVLGDDVAPDEGNALREEVRRFAPQTRVVRAHVALAPG